MIASVTLGHAILGAGIFTIGLVVGMILMAVLSMAGAADRASELLSFEETRGYDPGRSA